MGKQLTCKKSLLMICKILILFVSILSGIDKSSLLNRDNLMQPIEMQFSHKQNIFHQFFSAFLNFSDMQNLKTVFEHIECC